MKDLEQKIKELEKRELELEAYCNGLYGCFDKLYTLFPFKVENIDMLSDVATALLNQAEIRVDINERVKMEIEW